jgi:hypothetical protein
MIITQSVKKVLNAKAAFVVTVAFAVMCTAATRVNQANLSGSWKLNEQKSELGQFGGRMTAKTLKLEQKEDGLSIERTSNFNGEDRTSTEKLSFDGKESENTVFGTAKKKSTAKWSEDGQTLTVNSVVTFERDGQTMEIKSTETWKLINDGQGLSVETNSTSQMGNNTVKAVFEKSK